MAIELRSAEQIARSLLAQVDLEPIDIGIAPVKPAEFVIFRIGQYAPEA